MSMHTKIIERKMPLDIINIAYAGEIISKYFHRLPISLPVGLKETSIESHAVNYLSTHQCTPAMKEYRDFPADISISKNYILAHGIPSDEMLEKHDLVTVDIVGEYNGWHADMSWTYSVGDINEENAFLMNAAWRITRAGMQVIKVGNTLKDVAEAIQEEAMTLGIHVYSEFVGHGIGKQIHEPPMVIYNKQAQAIPITSGMVLCIEPIISIGHQEVMKLPDGAYIGLKKLKTAVYEHMVGVFENDVKILSYNMCTPQEVPVGHPFLP